MRPDLRALAALAALVSGATGAGAGPVPSVAPASSQLRWHICKSFDQSFLCSELAVPIDYSQPSAGSLKLALIERPATDAPVLGDIVINPGGPGGSGVQYLKAPASTFLPS